MPIKRGNCTKRDKEKHHTTKAIAQENRAVIGSRGSVPLRDLELAVDGGPSANSDWQKEGDCGLCTAL